MNEKPEMKVKNFDRMLVGVDDSPDSQLAFRYAMNHAKKDNATLIICSILESDNMNVYQILSKDYIHGQLSDLEKHLKDYVKLAKDFGVQNVISVAYDEGDPGETLVKHAISDLNADVLIIGSRSKRDIRKNFGSQAAYIVKHAPISVFVIR